MACQAIEGKFTFFFIMCVNEPKFLVFIIFYVNLPFPSEVNSKSYFFSKVFLKDIDLIDLGTYPRYFFGKLHHFFSFSFSYFDFPS